MKRCKFLLPIMTLTLLLMGSLDVMAQQVSSFEQLQFLVRPGDKITVTPAATQKPTEGRITNLSPSTLKISVAGVEHQFSQNDILEIKQKRPDPLSNGAKWGFLVGAGLGVGGGAAVCADGGYRGCAAVIIAGGLVYGGLGAAVGVGIDAMIHTNQTIYRPENRVVSSLHVAPILSGKRKGVAMSFSF